MPTLSLRFIHGLGDACNFAHLLPLWIRRGWDVEIECTPDKRLLFQAAGARITQHARDIHDWPHPHLNGRPTPWNPWIGNKALYNIDNGRLPPIGDAADLWQEYVATRVDLAPFIPESARQSAARLLSGLPRPIVLFHPMGNTSRELKNLSHEQQRDFLERFLDNPGAVFVLDWDERTFRLRHDRVRYPEAHIGLPELYCLIEAADLLVSVDSGPLHFARFTKTPAVGVWVKHFPAHFVLPRRNTLNVALPGCHHADWIPCRRVPYNVVTGDLVAWTRAMRAAPRWLARRAENCLLQSLLNNLAQEPEAHFADRRNSWRLVLDYLAKKKDPVCLEIGCMRQAEDWSAGMSSYLLGFFLRSHGGTLDSVDLSPENIQTANYWCDYPMYHCRHSHEFLREYSGPKFDFVYLDGMDLWFEGHAESTLAEAKLLGPHLAGDARILIDDSLDGTGKGKLAIPWLVERGWKVVHDGYQVLLAR